MAHATPTSLRALALPALLAVAGCAASPPRPAPSRDVTAALDHWIGPGNDGAAGEGRAPSVTLSRAPQVTGPVTIHTAVADPPRPRRSGRVDVSFRQADMANAFQFLAEAGRFNLVLESGLGGQVSATLRGVDPYDALVSLAEANGARVHYDRQIVVVSKR